MTVAEARKALDREIRILRTMEAVHCSMESRANQAKDVARKIDALIEAAKREVVAAEQAGLAEAASLVSDPKAGGHA